MSEVLLYMGNFMQSTPTAPECWKELVHLKGYLAPEKRTPRRILQYDHPLGPLVALGGGLSLMSEVPL